MSAPLHEVTPGISAAVVHVQRYSRRSRGQAAPDLMIRNYGDTAYVGTGIINSTAVRQAQRQDQPFFPSIFQVRVTNNGTGPDKFVITGPASNSSYRRIWYYDSQVQGGHAGGGNYTTPQVTAGGWTTPLLQPGASYDFRFEIGASPLAPARAHFSVQLKATSVSDPSKSDVVQGTAYDAARDEVEIRRRNYAQITGESGTYLLDLQNYGNRADTYTVTATGSGAGYTVKFFDAYAGGRDVTSQVTGAGWTTTPIEFHAIQNMAVQIISTDRGAHSVQLTMTSTNDPTVSRTVTISNTAAQSATPSFFPIGVWDQPTGNFDTWKQRGINTLVQYDSYGNTQSIAYWSQIALDKGLHMIRQADTDPAADAAKWSNLLAWMQPDEPELRSDFSTGDAAATYSQLKAADPKMPVFVNFDASDIVGWQKDVSAATYQRFMSAADWISGGMYPISGWNRLDDLDVMGRAVDRMEAMDQGAPTFAVIESSNQEGPWLPANSPSPTPTQVRAQVWDSVIHGARGIIYFPQQLSEINGFNYDAIPPGVAAEITKIDAQLTSIGAALESPLDPPTAGVTVSAPLEATWRTYHRHNYFIVFNYSARTISRRITLGGTGRAKAATVVGESRSVSLNRGAFTDTFAPYSAHIYAV
jgi:hypothetical protein